MSSVAKGKLSLQDFYRRCAQAWIMWSPEGLGWDCFRHYESARLRSVPVINQPTIERYRPLDDGVPRALLRRAQLPANAMKRRSPTRTACGTIARDGQSAHVLAHHTLAALGNYVVETTLGAQS